MTQHRYNVRNKSLSEANTKLVLASLKSQARTITELCIITGLTRQTITRKLDQLNDIVLFTETHPRRYYLKGVEYKTVIDEVVDKETGRKSQTKQDAVKAAILSDSPVVFFPQATHHDLSMFHDKVIGGDAIGHLAEAYREVSSKKELDNLEAALKTMYDLVQFRKTLKGEFE